VLNRHAGFTPKRNRNFVAGVDNVFDKLYYDPLAGVNRVTGSAVPVGLHHPCDGPLAVGENGLNLLRRTR
jgi:hypothetical protein